MTRSYGRRMALALVLALCVTSVASPSVSLAAPSAYTVYYKVARDLLAGYGANEVAKRLVSGPLPKPVQALIDVDVALALELRDICAEKPLLSDTYNQILETTKKSVFLNLDYIFILALKDRQTKRTSPKAVLESIDKENRATMNSAIASCDRTLNNPFTWIVMPRQALKIRAIRTNLIQFRNKGLGSAVAIYNSLR